MLDKYIFLPEYSKIKSDLYRDFYKPCMEQSIKYDRVTGYFGSSIFIIINEALEAFINNNGKIRIICSPILKDEDLHAIKQGYLERKNNLEDYQTNLNEIIDIMHRDYPKSTELLSSLIKNGIVEIKLAVFGNNPDAARLVHDKVGLFTDSARNMVGFRGSMNETYSGLSSNGNMESFDVFTSWEDGKDKERVKFVTEMFEKIWNDKESNVATYDIPETSYEKIKSFATDIEYYDLLKEIESELVLIEQNKFNLFVLKDEYCLGEKIRLPKEYTYAIKDEIKDKLVLNNESELFFTDFGTFEILMMPLNKKWNSILKFNVKKWRAEPDKRKPRSYQEEILNNWEANRFRGLFEMATGSGKTFTAICAIRLAMFKYNKIPLIIVPSELLFNQWNSELKLAFGENVPIYKFGVGHSNIDNLALFSSPTGNRKIILATIQTASGDTFVNEIKDGNHIFLLIDEVHNAGALSYSNVLNIKSEFRLGLSATPRRYRDHEGTKMIFDYFDKIIEPKYTLEKAIGNALCDYYYYPSIVKLSNSEKEKYLENSKKISQIYARLISRKNIKNNEVLSDSGLKRLLIERADIIKKAKSKIDLALKILTDEYDPNANHLQRWLIYCDDQEQLEDVKIKIQTNLNDRIYSNLFVYHSQVTNKGKILENFENNGGILLAINCLDEGVDIPSIDHAIILSSSQNNRQFIQRRGRVLRHYKNKNFAHIYDAIVSPEENENNEKFPFLIYELKRAILFAKNSSNSDISILRIKELAIKNMINIEKIEEENEGFENE